MDIRQIRNDDDEQAGLDSLASVLASKHAVTSLVFFIGAGILLLLKPDGSIATTLHPYAPAVMSLTGSFLAGLIVGRIARRSLKPVLIAGGVIVVVIGLLTKFGVIGPAADEWVNSSVGWVSQHFDTFQSYIATLLPSATAASGGLYLGFRRKRKPRQHA